MIENFHGHQSISRGCIPAHWAIAPNLSFQTSTSSAATASCLSRSSRTDEVARIRPSSPRTRSPYRIVLPFTIYNERITPAGERLIFFFLASPVSDNEIDRYMFLARNYALDESDDKFRKFSLDVARAGQACRGKANGPKRYLPGSERGASPARPPTIAPSSIDACCASSASRT